MILISDLLTLRTFFQQATSSVGDISFFGISNGDEGIQEIQSLMETTINPGQVICLMQVAEIPLSEGAYAKATFACTIMLLKKMNAGKITFDVKLETRNELWKQMLKLIGKVKLAAEWFQKSYEEKPNEAYDVHFSIFQDRVLPVGKIANANVQGWLVDIDVSIPVNDLMYN